MKFIGALFFALSLVLAVDVLPAAAIHQEPADRNTYVPPKDSSRPSCRSCPDPEFPAEARKAKLSSALVVLDVVISAEGQAEDIHVVTNPGHGFAENAVKAVKKWKFKPATAKDGSRVPVKIKIEINFLR